MAWMAITQKKEVEGIQRLQKPKFNTKHLYSLILLIAQLTNIYWVSMGQTGKNKAETKRNTKKYDRALISRKLKSSLISIRNKNGIFIQPGYAYTGTEKCLK